MVCVASLLFIIGVTLISLNLSFFLCKKRIIYTFVMVVMKTKHDFIQYKSIWHTEGAQLVVTFITVMCIRMHTCVHWGTVLLFSGVF